MQNFWLSFNDWWFSVYNMRIGLNKFDIIFGILDDSDDNILFALNFCILYAKGYIHDCKLQEKDCTMSNFKSQLVKRVEVEKYLLDLENDQDTFIKIWQPLFSDLTSRK